LLLRHRPRTTQDSALQRDTQSQCLLDRAADAGSVALCPRTQVPVVRPRRQVWRRRCVGGKANRKSADPYRVSQPLAEGLCFTLHLLGML
jgi:hypothetical protein